MRSNQQSRITRRLTVADRLRRFGDFLIALMLLGLTLPLMMIVTLAIKWESPGPVLDRHTCIGCGGRRFQMLKFRTATYDPQRGTPRWEKTTGVGQLLWWTRIEELPQLINVLRGEMSILDRDGRTPSFLD
jgi:lipopolysaccharide/colanic/teichoic acid biosynthesis glycosyltransferase